MVQLPGPITCSVLTYCSSRCSLWYERTVVALTETELEAVQEKKDEKEEESPNRFSRYILEMHGLSNCRF